MNLYAGIFDYVIFGLLVLVNILYWRKKISTKLGCIVILLSFGLILPLVSIAIEMRIFETQSVEKPFEDGFETFYTLYRMPMYWIVGIVQVALLALRNKIKQNKNQ